MHYHFTAQKNDFLKFYITDFYIGANFIRMAAEFPNCVHQLEPAELVK